MVRRGIAGGLHRMGIDGGPGGEVLGGYEGDCWHEIGRKVLGDWEGDCLSGTGRGIVGVGLGGEVLGPLC